MCQARFYVLFMHSFTESSQEPFVEVLLFSLLTLRLEVIELLGSRTGIQTHISLNHTSLSS
jgi:hypothetical protein